MTLRNPETLDELYANRLDTAWDSLYQDIQRWQDAMGDTDGVITHHLQEFAKFSRHAYLALIPSQPSETGDQSSKQSNQINQSLGDNLDAQDFRAVVIGVLTAYWTLLRQVAAQRLPGSPYYTHVQQLDQLSIQYYYRLRQALPSDLQAQIVPCAPIVHLGDMSMLTIYNRQPLVLSVPLNAIDDNPNAQKSQAAIPHEIGHAIFLQIPKLLEELSNKLKEKQKGLSKQQQILAEMINYWLEEILADMIGTALASDAFLISAIWITATSEANVGLADQEHPPTVIRPFIHLKVLEYLEAHNQSTISQLKQTKSDYTNTLDDLRQQFIMKTVGNRLERQFKSIPVLTFITLDDVKNALEETVELLLKPSTDPDALQLAALDNQTIGDLLINCAQQTNVLISNNQLNYWGDLQAEDLRQFSLPISGNLETIFNTPMTISKRICDWLPFLPFCRR
ncbi:hypothetical protein H6F90_00200 [Trichocoleus sp. FACHB-591]|uniref:hypothetical protein n=1 Tax=Trichocoleus sp. FACHB-591 TaxID=2692872 RepID=UPI00168522AB|nr:hypothetical protein [Trichocoleus sp. FACHB-591]MBD2093575.1 hypothetical protein [Trichocoleus sp. FACHB-591]